MKGSIPNNILISRIIPVKVQMILLFLQEKAGR